MKKKSKPGTMFYVGNTKDFIGLNPILNDNLYEINVNRIVYGSGFIDGKSAYDKCKGHKWQHRKKLRKDWVYCSNCKTQQHEDLK